MALAAFAVRSGEKTRQVQMVCLDDLVPVDDELRRIEALVDWEHVRATAALQAVSQLPDRQRRYLTLAASGRTRLEIAHAAGATQTNVIPSQRCRLRAAAPFRRR